MAEEFRTTSDPRPPIEAVEVRRRGRFCWQWQVWVAGRDFPFDGDAMTRRGAERKAFQVADALALPPKPDPSQWTPARRPGTTRTGPG